MTGNKRENEIQRHPCDDEVERYLLLSNGHDGRTALKIRFTPVRVVCQNTLNFALSFGRDLLRSHHGQGMDQRIERAQEAVGVILKQYESLAKNYQRLADTQINAERLDRYLSEVFPTPTRKAKQGNRSYDAAVLRVSRLRSVGERLFEQGKGNNLKGIGWNALHAQLGLQAVAACGVQKATER